MSPNPSTIDMKFHDVILNVTSSGSVSNITNTVTVPSGCVVFPFSKYSPWDNPEDLVSNQTYQSLRDFMNVYLLTIFFLLSTPLNIVNMIVFWKHGIRERINLCLFFLSLADFIIVTGHFEWNLDQLYSAITNTPYKITILKFNINNMIHSLAGFIYISGFMTTLIAFERCLCVVSPLRAQSIIQIKSSAAIIAIGHVLIFGGHYVIATRVDVVCMFDPFIRQSMDKVYPSEFYIKNKAFVDILDGIVFGILLPGFYVTGVSLSTVVTVVKLRHMKEWRQQTSSASTSSGTALKDITLTRMLIGTNVLFVVCTIPPFIFMLLPFFPELSLSGKYYNTYLTLILMQQLSSYINSSVNFFVYYFFGTKFHLTVQHMFCRSRKSKGNKLHRVNRTTALSVSIQESDFQE